MAKRSPINPINDVVDFLSRGPSRAEIVAFRLSPAAVLALQDLLVRNASGTITAEEQRELDQMVLIDDLLSLVRARAQGDTTAASA